MAGIKSVKVKTAGGKTIRTQIGSKSYNAATSGGGQVVSGSGKNLSSRDIKGVQGSYGGYTDSVSTTRAKRAANQAGDLLPWQEGEGADIGQAPVAPTPIEQTPGQELTAKTNELLGSEQFDPTTGKKINTNQPSPATAQIGMQEGDVANGQRLLPDGTLTPDDQILAAVKATGDSPQDGGGAAGPIQDATPKAQESTIADQMFETIPFFQQLQEFAQDYYSPASQRQSMAETLAELEKDSGIEGINMELINTKNVIDGTEDDIRNEVMKAGGFMSESKVLALTYARNKQLVKNYNTLLETRNAKEAHLDKMMNFTLEDRRQADQQFDRMMDFQFKVQDYKDKMETNAKNDAKFVIGISGVDGAYNQALASGDPNAVQRWENLLGLAPGGMGELATLAEADRARQIKLENAQLANEYASTRNLESQIKDRDSGLEGKAPTASQSQAGGFASRLVQANTIFDDLEASLAAGESDYDPTKLGSRLFAFEGLKGEDRKKYEQAERNFINATLRRESGAAIAPSEFAEARQQYFPQLGDTEDVKSQKRANRQVVQENFINEAGNGYTAPEELVAQANERAGTTPSTNVTHLRDPKTGEVREFTDLSSQELSSALRKGYIKI